MFSFALSRFCVFIACSLVWRIFGLEDGFERLESMYMFPRFPIYAFAIGEI